MKWKFTIIITMMLIMMSFVSAEIFQYDLNAETDNFGTDDSFSITTGFINPNSYGTSEITFVSENVGSPYSYFEAFGTTMVASANSTEDCEADAGALSWAWEGNSAAFMTDLEVDGFLCVNNTGTYTKVAISNSNGSANPAYVTLTWESNNNYIIVDQFEMDLDKWNTTGDPEISTDYAYEGASSAKLDGDSGNIDTLSAFVGINQTGQQVLSMHVLWGQASINDDLELELTDNGTRILKLSASYPTSGEWGFDSGSGWASTNVSSIDGDTNVLQTWANIKVLFDQDNQQYSIRINDVEILTDEAFVGGFSFDRIVGISPTTATGEYMYLDLVEYWEYDIYGWGADPLTTYTSPANVLPYVNLGNELDEGQDIVDVNWTLTGYAPGIYNVTHRYRLGSGWSPYEEVAIVQFNTTFDSVSYSRNYNLTGRTPGERDSFISRVFDLSGNRISGTDDFMAFYIYAPWDCDSLAVGETVELTGDKVCSSWFSIATNSTLDCKGYRISMDDTNLAINYNQQKTGGTIQNCILNNTWIEVGDGSDNFLAENITFEGAINPNLGLISMYNSEEYEGTDGVQTISNIRFKNIGAIYSEGERNVAVWEDNEGSSGHIDGILFDNVNFTNAGSWTSAQGSFGDNMIINSYIEGLAGMDGFRFGEVNNTIFKDNYGSAGCEGGMTEGHGWDVSEGTALLPWNIVDTDFVYYASPSPDAIETVRLKHFEPGTRLDLDGDEVDDLRFDNDGETVPDFLQGASGFDSYPDPTFGTVLKPNNCQNGTVSWNGDAMTLNSINPSTQYICVNATEGGLVLTGEINEWVNRSYVSIVFSDGDYAPGTFDIAASYEAQNCVADEGSLSWTNYVELDGLAETWAKFLCYRDNANGDIGKFWIEGWSEDAEYVHSGIDDSQCIHTRSPISMNWQQDVYFNDVTYDNTFFFLGGANFYVDGLTLINQNEGWAEIALGDFETILRNVQAVDVPFSMHKPNHFEIYDSNFMSLGTGGGDFEEPSFAFSQYGPYIIANTNFTCSDCGDISAIQLALTDEESSLTMINITDVNVEGVYNRLVGTASINEAENLILNNVVLRNDNPDAPQLGSLINTGTTHQIYLINYHATVANPTGGNKGLSNNIRPLFSLTIDNYYSNAGYYDRSLQFDDEVAAIVNNFTTNCNDDEDNLSRCEVWFASPGIYNDITLTGTKSNVDIYSGIRVLYTGVNVTTPLQFNNLVIVNPVGPSFQLYGDGGGKTMAQVIFNSTDFGGLDIQYRAAAETWNGNQPAVFEGTQTNLRALKYLNIGSDGDMDLPSNMPVIDVEIANANQVDATIRGNGQTVNDVVIDVGVSTLDLIGFDAASISGTQLDVDLTPVASLADSEGVDYSGYDEFIVYRGNDEVTMYLDKTVEEATDWQGYNYKLGTLRNTAFWPQDSDIISSGYTAPSWVVDWENETSEEKNGFTAGNDWNGGDLITKFPFAFATGPSFDCSAATYNIQWFHLEELPINGETGYRYFCVQDWANRTYLNEITDWTENVSVTFNYDVEMVGRHAYIIGEAPYSFPWAEDWTRWAPATPTTNCVDDSGSLDWGLQNAGIHKDQMTEYSGARYACMDSVWGENTLFRFTDWVDDTSVDIYFTYNIAEIDTTPRTLNIQDSTFTDVDVTTAGGVWARNTISNEAIMKMSGSTIIELYNNTIANLEVNETAESVLMTGNNISTVVDNGQATKAYLNEFGTVTAVNTSDYCQNTYTGSGNIECPKVLNISCPAIVPASGETTQFEIFYAVEAQRDVANALVELPELGKEGTECYVTPEGGDLYTINCYVDMEYYQAPDTYDAYAYIEDDITTRNIAYYTENELTESNLCEYYQYLSSRITTGGDQVIVDFSLAVGDQDEFANNVIQIYNDGNQELSGYAMIGYDLAGVQLPSKIMGADNFRINTVQSLVGSVALENGVQVNLSNSIPIGNNSYGELYFIGSFPADLYPQTYYSDAPWSLVVTG